MPTFRPVVAVFAPATGASPLVQSLEHTYRLARSSDAKTFAENLARAHCGVALTARLPPEFLSSLPGRDPLPPVILVSPETVAVSTEREEDLPIGLLVERLPLSEVDLSVQRVVTTAVLTYSLITLRTVVLRHPRLLGRPELRKGLAWAFEKPGCYRVVAMAKEVRCSERTLEDEWQTFRGTNPLDVRLKEFLTVVTLLWAILVWLKNPGTPWAEIALTETRVHPRTLRRYVKRWKRLPGSGRV